MNASELLNLCQAANKERLTLTKITCLAVCLHREYEKLHAPNLTDLAKACNLSTAAMTGATVALQEHGLMKCIHGITDRRTIYAELTDRGKNVVEKLIIKAGGGEP